jgi:hypothetical protein
MLVRPEAVSDDPAALRIVWTALTLDKLAYGRYHLIGEPMHFGFGPQREGRPRAGAIIACARFHTETS